MITRAALASPKVWHSSNSTHAQCGTQAQNHRGARDVLKGTVTCARSEHAGRVVLHGVCAQMQHLLPRLWLLLSLGGPLLGQLYSNNTLVSAGLGVLKAFKNGAHKAHAPFVPCRECL